ncbi:MAG TPA: transposase [Mycobacterium sp.]
MDRCFWENLLVAIRYRPVERDQEFLLPPNMADWLDADHVVWFLIDVVAELDLTQIYERSALRRDGRPVRTSAGRAAYDPEMLLTLLIYGYACRERSSRQIERLCHTDIAFRLICAGDVPDHSVLARFRVAHAEAFAGLFTQVLRLCREAGLVKLCTVAIDGSKIAANASKQANRSGRWLDTEAEKIDRENAERADRVVVEQMLAEAAATDEVEDAEHGAARGDELPPRWGGRGGRRERIRAAKARIAAVEQARCEAEAAKAAKLAERDAAALAAAEQALAAQIASRVAAQHAWESAWEHAVADPDSPVPTGRAPKAPEESVLVRRAQARVDKARHRVAHPDIAPRRGRRPDPARQDKTPLANTTDPDSTIMPTRNGWIQGYNNQFAVSADQIILATAVSTNPADITSYETMVAATAAALTALGAGDELRTLLFDAGYASNDTLTAASPDQLIALGKTHSIQAAARDNPTSGPPPPGATARQAMDHRLRTPEGAKLYKRRGATVEPGIGNFKKLLDRYSQRGLLAATSETHLTATVFNLLKIHRTATT